MRLGLIDQPIAWTASPDTALAAVIIVDVWKTTPFMALLLLAGAADAARRSATRRPGSTASTRSRVFWKVTLPLLKPALMVAIIFRALDALRIFDLIYVMTGNNKATMSMSVYARQQLVDFQDVGYGSAAATMLFLIIAVFTVGLPDRRPRRPGGLSRRSAYAAEPQARQASLGRIGFYLLAGDHRRSTRCSRSTGRSSPRSKPAPSCSATDLLPRAPGLGNYVAVFREQPFARNILNSLFVAVSTVALSLALAVAAAYALGPDPASAAARCCCSPSSASRCSRRSPCCRACSSWSAGSASTTTCWR